MLSSIYVEENKKVCEGRYRMHEVVSLVSDFVKFLSVLVNKKSLY